VYDEWDPEDIGGAGGICDEIAQEIAGVIANRLGDVEIVDGGHDGDDHAWNIVYDDHDAYGVDIHPSVYDKAADTTGRKSQKSLYAPTMSIFFHTRAKMLSDVRPHSDAWTISNRNSKNSKPTPLMPTQA
jgi:hypothetical protein